MVYTDTCKRNTHRHKIKTNKSKKSELHALHILIPSSVLTWIFFNFFVENVMHRVLGNRDNLMIRLTLEFKDTGPCLSLTKKISELVPVQGNREAVCHLVLEFIKELPQLLFPYIIPSSRIKPHTAVCRPPSVVT